MGLRIYRKKLDAKARDKKRRAIAYRYRQYRATITNLLDGMMVEAPTSDYTELVYNVARELAKAQIEIDIFLNKFLGE